MSKNLSSGNIPESVKNEILASYAAIPESGRSVAVRSSATAEDLPTASFAGQHDSFLNINGEVELLDAIKRCYVSLYNDRAIKYRIDNGFEHEFVAISVGVQRMVRSDIGAAGVAFTVDPETGFENVIYITAAWGLGENVVQGAVNPDEFYVFKVSVEKGKRGIISKKMGEKEHKMIYAPKGSERPIMNVSTQNHERMVYSLSEDDVEKLGIWCLKIEQHYGMPMDIEWAKDGLSGELFIVQARPETIHGQKKNLTVTEYKIQTDTKLLCSGKAVGRAISSGRVCIVNSIADTAKVHQGDIIVADITNPDWNAMLRKAVCIVTNKGGRTSHASIVARELGIHAVVGCGNATDVLYDGQIITVSCADGDLGSVYNGKLEWEETEIMLDNIPETKTAAMFILADPDKAFMLSQYPNSGVGLLRMEFIVSNSIRIHPMALVKYKELPDSNDKKAIAAITRQQNDKKSISLRSYPKLWQW